MGGFQSGMTAAPSQNVFLFLQHPCTGSYSVCAKMKQLQVTPMKRS